MDDMIIGLHHVNLSVTCKEELDAAGEFWNDVLGLKEISVPQAQLGNLRWFEMPSGHQIHISVSKIDPGPTHFQKANHVCFKLKSPQALLDMQQKIYEHHKKNESKAAAFAVDTPNVHTNGCDHGDMSNGDVNGMKERGFPARFFARDFVGNRLEFTL